MINSVCLVGYLGADPEIRSTQSGTKVAKMRLAVSEFRSGGRGEERNVRTHWFSLNAWERTADICERFLKKGSRIAVRGSLEYQEWMRKDGSGKTSKVEIRVKELEMLDPRPDRNTDFERPAQTSGSHSQPIDSKLNISQTDSPPPEETYPADEFTSMTDDDIPF
jgi:single-strand DNA-binding protein